MNINGGVLVILTDAGSGEGIGNSSICVSAYEMCQELIVHAGLVPATCLAKDCLEEHVDEPPGSGSSRPTAAQGGNTISFC